MKEIDLKNLRSAEEIDEFYYHATGLVEAHDRIREQLADLDELYGKNWDKAADKLTELWVEIFEHALYHMKKLRRPFSDLIDDAYDKSDSEGPEAGVGEDCEDNSVGLSLESPKEG